jgi:hypothetical protein
MHTSPPSVKEIPRRRITVTSSVNETSTDQLGIWWWLGGGGGGGVTPPVRRFLDPVSQNYFLTTFYLGSFSTNIQREFWIFYRGPGFLPWHVLAPSPLPPPPVVSLLNLYVCRRSSLLTGEWGRGWGRSQIIRRRENLVLYESFNTLFVRGAYVKWVCK